MYRILLTKTGFPSDVYTFYKKTTSTIDPDDGSVITTTSIFETDDMNVLEEEYLKLLDTYAVKNVLPIDNLSTVLDVLITDETS
jgi:hypothetical protein